MKKKYLSAWKILPIKAITLALILCPIITVPTNGTQDEQNQQMLEAEKRRTERLKKVKALRPESKVSEPIYIGTDFNAEGNWRAFNATNPRLKELRQKPQIKLAAAKMEDVNLRDFINASSIPETGKDVGILIMEVNGVPPNERCIDCRLSVPRMDNVTHGLSVLDTLKQVAPDCNIYGDTASLNKNPNHLLLDTTVNDTFKIVNASFGSSDKVYLSQGGVGYVIQQKDINPDIKSDISKMLNMKQLFVLSAGNTEGCGLETNAYAFELNNQKREQGVNNFIITVSITAHGVMSDFSTIPGKSSLKEDTIATIGTDIINSISGEKASGTSLSAPIVSGAAALIFERYPDFTAFDVKECLLESADRRFYMPKINPAYSLRTALVEKNVLVDLDTEKGQEQFGKGILNVKNAMLYADIMAENKDKSLSERKELFKARVQKIENNAAQKIIDLGKIYLEKSKKRPSKHVQTFDSESIDIYDLIWKNTFLRKEISLHDTKGMGQLYEFLARLQTKFKKMGTPDFWNEHFDSAKMLSEQARKVLVDAGWLNQNVFTRWMEDNKDISYRKINSSLLSLQGTDQLLYFRNMNLNGVSDKNSLINIFQVVSILKLSDMEKEKWINRNFINKYNRQELIYLYDELTNIFGKNFILKIMEKYFKKAIEENNISTLSNIVQSSWGIENRDIINNEIVLNSAINWNCRECNELLIKLYDLKYMSVDQIFSKCRDEQDMIYRFLSKNHLDDAEFKHMISRINKPEILERIWKHVYNADRLQTMIDTYFSVFNEDSSDPKLLFAKRNFLKNLSSKQDLIRLQKINLVNILNYYDRWRTLPENIQSILFNDESIASIKDMDTFYKKIKNDKTKGEKYITMLVKNKKLDLSTIMDRSVDTKRSVLETSMTNVDSLFLRLVDDDAIDFYQKMPGQNFLPISFYIAELSEKGPILDAIRLVCEKMNAHYDENKPACRVYAQNNLFLDIVTLVEKTLSNNKLIKSSRVKSSLNNLKELFQKSKLPLNNEMKVKLSILKENIESKKQGREYLSSRDKYADYKVGIDMLDSVISIIFNFES
ncbi:MAG: hypothetical protein HEEMFOPI_00236 [Holosporales bacterium]